MGFISLKGIFFLIQARARFRWKYDVDSHAITTCLCSWVMFVRKALIESESFENL